ncbi:Plasmid maintenance system antidote protein, XRE family (modular protein) [uncultured Alphaproteobacteria bacterium]|uniref:Plasmid maintenance system antidote protein, XRE family (Modular protein) n=1 Tax=uncultured Alphaproteobacteria bacterium TaxID=91750 RepID=A0A212JMW1_9PROT|nr:Plasmid maintenance system antidote protein, XRE family (modular protein) [uncultured Alphaproteobacteria bacterium]
MVEDAFSGEEDEISGSADIPLFCPGLFTLRPPNAPPILRAVGGTGHRHEWLMTSPAVVVLFDRQWRRFRITPDGGLEIATGSRRAWRAIDNDEMLKRIGGIRTERRIYSFKAARWHASRWLTTEQLACPYITLLGGETIEQEMERRRMSIPVDEQRLPPIHPGLFLREEFGELLLEIELVAKALGVPLETMRDLLAERISITEDLDRRLASYFGMSEGFWLGLQRDYETRDLPRWPERNQPPAQEREDPFPTFTEWSGDADTHLAQQLADLAAEHLPAVVDELPKDEEKP